MVQQETNPCDPSLSQSQVRSAWHDLRKGHTTKNDFRIVVIHALDG